MKKNVKKLLKTIAIVFIIISIISMVNIRCYAEGVTDVTENPESWKPTASSSSTVFEAKVGNILGVISVIGTIMSVITLSIIGIKFMLGSVEEKASYKKALVPWLIGAILVFAMTTIPAIIYNISGGILN